ncbi:MAG TPA: hypothetical protein VMU41_14840 [Candidatus Binataceae bacterium]|nr:hypothetical protein [Candidatus Binataceae bacterium]
MNPSHPGAWITSWLCSVPLIVITVVIHVYGLSLIAEFLSESVEGRKFRHSFIGVIGLTALLATALHGIEGVIWAVAFRLVGALSDANSAMLYSIGAMTTFGHANLYLEKRWQMMGALEALNGIILFGITTAFMFAIIQRVWPLRRTITHT